MALPWSNWSNPPVLSSPRELPSLRLRTPVYAAMWRRIQKIFPVQPIYWVGPQNCRFFNPTMGDISDSLLKGGYFGHPPEINERVLWYPIFQKVILKPYTIFYHIPKIRPISRYFASIVRFDNFDLQNWHNSLNFFLCGAVPMYQCYVF